MHEEDPSGLVKDEGVSHVADPWREAGQIVDEDLSLLVVAVAVVVVQAHDPVCIRHVHGAAEEGHVIGPEEAVGGDDDLVGAAVTIAVR